MAFPLLVPLSPNDPGAAEMRQARAVLSHWDKPAFVLFSDKDPITRGGDRFFRRLIPTAKDQPEVVIEDAGHFLQEEKGEEIAQHIVDFIKRTPISLEKGGEV
jgi:haloalkane dehalogenase